MHDILLNPSYKSTTHLHTTSDQVVEYDNTVGLINEY